MHSTKALLSQESCFLVHGSPRCLVPNSHMKSQQSTVATKSLESDCSVEPCDFKQLVSPL